MGSVSNCSLFALAKREEWNHDLELIGMVSPYFCPYFWRRSHSGADNHAGNWNH
jgi:hypothetical protein